MEVVLSDTRAMCIRMILLTTKFSKIARPICSKGKYPPLARMQAPELIRHALLSKTHLRTMEICAIPLDTAPSMALGDVARAEVPLANQN